MDTKDTSPGQAQAPAPAPRKRKWPRRVAIGVAITGVLVGGTLWYLGRETTLQMIAQRVAKASGGKLTLSGVSGSLYGAMHIERMVWRTDEQLVIADKIDLQWSPRQIVSSGVLVDSLHAASLRMETLKESDEPTTMPASLAPPFPIAVNDARLAQATFVNQGAETRIDNIRLKLKGDKQSWVLRDASASTPWGLVAANASIASQRPFKLDGAASLTQSEAQAGARAAQLKLKVGGDLNTTLVDASGQAGRAVGDGRLELSPFAPIPLRAVRINARNIDPGFFNPALPTADLTLAVNGRLNDKRNITGSVNLTNDGPAGTIDQQRLPLRAMRGQLGGSLDALQVSDVLMDFGAAGRFTGVGGVQRGKDEKGLGTARFTLHTDRFDLKGIHGSMKPTAIRGDIQVTNEATRQTLQAKLADKGMRLAALATLENNVLTLREARLAAGAGSINASGSLDLTGNKTFKGVLNASRFDPAALGDYPDADINASVNAAGALAPAWRVDADFAVRRSRLFGQPLAGSGKLHADAKRLSGIDADLALGRNTVALNGAFGGNGDRLQWRVDGRELAAVRSDLYGAATASGVATGTMAAPRTTFEVNAQGLGWVAKPRQNNAGSLRATGEAWLAGPEGAKAVEVKASGTAQRFNPAAFGSPLAGDINAVFDASGRAGKEWRGALDLRVQDSTLAKSPFWGHAKLAADRRHVSNADVDLHVGPNIVAAKGSFGAEGGGKADRLDWRIDAPQLAALGPDYGGVLRGAGIVSGTMDTPSLTASLNGENLKLLGKHTVRSLRASANLGSGRGARDPFVTDVQVQDYVSGETRIAALSLQSEGTRGAHTVRLAARGDNFDASTEVRGALAGDTWNGTLAALQNRGRYAMNLAAPVPLRIGGAPGSGIMGLAKPERIAFNGAVIKLPSGSVTVDTLSKNGPRWISRGHADNVPLTWLAQFSPALRDNARGDLTLGAQWALDLRAPAVAGGAPALDGNVRVFRERGDAIVGGDTPVPLGLRQFEASANVVGSKLRVRLDLDGARTGKANVEANAQLLRGRLDRDSPLRMSANADMASIAWLAPLAGQPGLELDGALRLALTGAGTIGTPSLNGKVSGDNLAVRWAEQGVRLQNGQLRAQLAGDRLELQRLAFQGRQGSASAEGFLRFSSGLAGADLRLRADKLEALSRPDRTVVVSGQASLVRDASRFELEGRFKADRALIELAPQGRPTMSDDVIVLGRGTRIVPSNEEKEMPLAVDLRVDLGDEFRLRGMGIEATLAGDARVRKTGARPPRINGTIRATEGTYAAYGQRLAIERAVITFSGAYDNPALDILAVRKRPEGEQLSETNVEAGVQVRGSAQAPQARLVSTPNVPDSEKLSWLVLGHGMEGTSGNEKDVLAAAAGALLGGKGGSGGITSKLKNSLNVDELGLKQANGQANGLEGTVVTVGKRISSRAYLSFEQGATTATSLVRLRYKLNPRITLQFQTGTNTALDILYSWAFD